MARRLLVGGLLALVGVLAIASPIRRVGDGGEYMAMALNMSSLRPPALRAGDLVRIEQRFATLRAGFDVVPFRMPALVGRDGRQDFPHFWLYSALAVPALWITEAVGAHPNIAFTLLNIGLLALALWIVAGRLSPALTMLLFASPLIWWIDKAHGDVYTCALLSIAFALLPTRRTHDGDRGWSLVALGAAAAQNPAIAPVWPVVALTLVLTRLAALRERRFWITAVAGAALTILPAAYYEWRLGVPTPIIGWTHFHVPAPGELGAFIWDPNIGLLPNFPALAVALLWAVVSIARRREWPGLSVCAAGMSAVLLLVAFAQSVNINHGGTPGMNRWTLWLAPLAIPLFRQAEESSVRAPRWLWALAIASCLWSVAQFRPALREDYQTPSSLASFLWSRFPGLDNPPIEIFAERAGRSEPGMLPVASGDCRKVLVADGRWPAPCLPPIAFPASCAVEGSTCYANDSGHGYVFTPTTRTPGLDVRDNAASWPLSERFSRSLRQVLGSLGTDGLKAAPAIEDGAMLRAESGVAWTYALQAEDRVFIYISKPTDEALLTLRLPASMSGAFVDLSTGAQIETVVRAGTEPDSKWDLKVPSGKADVALVLKKP